jgi:hypothetical protein
MQEFSTGKFHGDPTSLRTPAAIAAGVQSNIALSSSFCLPQAQPLPLISGIDGMSRWQLKTMLGQLLCIG